MYVSVRQESCLPKMRLSGCIHLFLALRPAAFFLLVLIPVEVTLGPRQTQSMQANDILANDRRIAGLFCDACNRRFGSRFAYDQHRRSSRLIGTACYTGNDDQHHELISSRRSNISTALLRIGHARSRASRWPTHIIKAITNIPLKNRIILHFWHYYVWLPGWTQNPTREPDIIMLKIRFLGGRVLLCKNALFT